MIFIWFVSDKMFVKMIGNVIKWPWAIESRQDRRLELGTELVRENNKERQSLQGRKTNTVEWSTKFITMYQCYETGENVCRSDAEGSSTDLLWSKISASESSLSTGKCRHRTSIITCSSDNRRMTRVRKRLVSAIWRMCCSQKRIVCGARAYKSSSRWPPSLVTSKCSSSGSAFFCRRKRISKGYRTAMVSWTVRGQWISVMASSSQKWSLSWL